MCQLEKGIVEKQVLKSLSIPKQLETEIETNYASLLPPDVPLNVDEFLTLGDRIKYLEATNFLCNLQQVIKGLQNPHYRTIREKIDDSPELVAKSGTQKLLLAWKTVTVKPWSKTTSRPEISLQKMSNLRIILKTKRARLKRRGSF